MLIYQNQDCDLTLREGIKVYEDYLVANGKIPLKEPNNESTLIRSASGYMAWFGM